MYRNVKRGSVAKGELVLRRRLNSNKYHDYVLVKLEFPLATVSAKVALAEVLPIKGVDFLLGNDIAGTSAFPQLLIVSEEMASSPRGKCPCAVTRSVMQLADGDERRAAQVYS